MKEETMGWRSILVILLLLGVPLSFNPVAAHDEDFVCLGELPLDSIGDIDVSWDHSSNTFYLIAGDDSFGPAGHHVRSIFQGNATGFKKIYTTDDIFDYEYHRFESIACNPASDYTLISGINGSLWKLINSELTQIKNNDSNPLWDISWSPDGSYAILGGSNFILKWDGVSLQQINSSGHGFRDASWAPDGKYALLADGSIDEIGYYDGNQFRTISISGLGYSGCSVSGVAFSPIGEFALVELQNHDIFGCNGYLIAGYNKTGFHCIDSTYGWTGKITWNPNGSYAFVCGNMNESYQDGKLIKTDMIDEKRTLGWSPDGKYLLAWTFDDVVTDNGTKTRYYLWKYTTNSELNNNSMKETGKQNFKIISPINGSTLNSTSVLVQGKAEDISLIQKVEISGNGVLWTTCNGKNNWSGILTLKPGSRKIYARSISVFNNLMTDRVGVIVKGPVDNHSVSTPGYTIGTLIMAFGMIMIVISKRKCKRNYLKQD
jgi:hypothetical protein